MQLIALRHYHDGVEMLTDRLFRDGDRFKLQEAPSSVEPMEWRCYDANAALRWVLDDPASVEWIAADAPSCDVLSFRRDGRSNLDGF